MSANLKELCLELSHFLAAEEAGMIGDEAWHCEAKKQTMIQLNAKFEPEWWQSLCDTCPRCAGTGTIIGCGPSSDPSQGETCHDCKDRKRRIEETE